MTDIKESWWKFNYRGKIMINVMKVNKLFESWSIWWKLIIVMNDEQFYQNVWLQQRITTLIEMNWFDKKYFWVESSSLWWFFTLMKNHCCDENSFLWWKFFSVIKVHECDKNSSHWWKPSTLMYIHHYDEMWWLMKIHHYDEKDHKA